MSFQIHALDPAPFQNLYGLSEMELRERNVVRMKVTYDPGFPCRTGLRDTPLNGWALLVNHAHQTAASPYRATGPIFVEEGRDRAAIFPPGVIPDVLTRRLLSLRAYDADGMITDADVVDGQHVEPLIERLFSEATVAEIHVHFARRGCYAARITRS